MIVFGKHHYLKLLNYFFFHQDFRKSNNTFVLIVKKKSWQCGLKRYMTEQSVTYCAVLKANPILNTTYWPRFMHANIIFKGKQCHLYFQQGSFRKNKLVGDTNIRIAKICSEWWSLALGISPCYSPVERDNSTVKTGHDAYLCQGFMCCSEWRCCLASLVLCL